MRRVFFSLMTLVAGSLFQVQAQTTQLFDCVEPTSLEIDGKCVETKIDQNRFFLNLQDQFAAQQELSSDNVIATLILDEQKMQIEIVAHKDAIAEKTLMAANNPD